MSRIWLTLASNGTRTRYGSEQDQRDQERRTQEFEHTLASVSLIRASTAGLFAAILDDVTDCEHLSE